MTSELRPFWEYEIVKRKTRDLGRLEALHEVRLSRAEADQLIAGLCAEFGLRAPRVSYTGRSDRGRYEWAGRIIVRGDRISAECICHELAHHWCWTKMTGAMASHHGEDFIWRLDKLAEKASGLLGKIGG